MINVNENGFVSARELHKALWLKGQYQNWIDNVLSFDFQEGIDFNFNSQIKVQKEGKSNVKRTFKNVLFTINAAKEVVMISKAPKGKEVRRRLISLSNKKDRVLYKNKLQDYGITCLLVLLEIFEKKQDFKECAKIVAMIKQHNKDANDCLPTKIEEADLSSFNIKQFNKIVKNAKNIALEVFLLKNENVVNVTIIDID